MGQDDPLDEVSMYTMYSPEQIELIDTVVLPTIEREGRWTGPVTYVNKVTGAVTEVESDVQLVADPLRPGVRIFASVSRDVTELNALAAAERRRRELGSFAAELAQRALDQGSDALFADSFTVLAPFAELLNADLAYLDAIDLDAGVLRPLGDWTSARYELPLVPPQEIALNTIPRWIERLQRSRILLGSTTEELTTPWAAELELVFGHHPGGMNLYAPLRVNGQLLGVLGLTNFDTSHAWSADEIDTVQQVADTLASLFARQRADAAVRASEAHLAAMLANVDDVLVVIDPTGQVRYANAAIERATGHSIAEVVGRHFLDFILPDDHAMAIENFAATVSGRDERSLSELRVLRPDGRSTWFEVDTSGSFDDVLGGFVLTLRDVSARRSAIEAARRRQEFEEVVLEVARWALATESEMPLDGIEEHLGRLANAVGCDSVVVSFANDDVIETAAEWRADRRVSRGPGRGTQRRSPAFADRLRELEPLAVTDVFDVKEPWVAEARARPEPYRSALHVPLVSSDRCVGDIEVSMSATTRVWTTEETSLVQRISETLASLLARQRLEASLRESEARLAAFLDGSHDLVVVVDASGTIMFTNEAVHRRLGYRPEELIGRNASVVIHPDDVAEALRRLGTLVAGQPTMMTTVRLIGASGAVAWWEITSGARRDPVAGGNVLICREVSARLLAEGENSKRVEHLRYAFDLAQSALDLGTTEFLARLDIVCASIAAMLGADRVYVDHIDEHDELLINRGTHLANQVVTDLRSGGAVRLGLLPSWIETLRSAEPVVVVDIAKHDAPWIDEKRRSLGTEAALMAVGMSAAGALVGVVGVSMVATPRDWTNDEVTFLRIIAETIAHVFERSRVDEALRSSEARFRLLSETAADVVILIDAEGIIRYASPSSMDLLGFTPDNLVGRPARSLMDPNHLEFFLSAGPALLMGSPFTAEGRMVRADGTSVWVANSTSAVIDPESGRAIEYRTSVRDITERKRLEAELVRQALHDPLTGLANRMLLQSRLLDATTHDERTEPDSAAAEVAVLLLDLDGFKEVNDTYGHAIGDEVLRVVAARLSALTRPSDTLARTGGDEFVVLCPATDSTGAVLIGERCVAAISQPMIINGITVRLGASVGVAHHTGAGADPDSLLLDADGAMYTAKQRGRGQVALANSASRAFGRYPQSAEPFSTNSGVPGQAVAP